VTGTDPVSNLDDDGFRVYLGFIIWITVLMAGLGSELLVFILYLQKTGWSKEKEAMWKVAQFVFPLLAATTLGLAAEEDYWALPILVACLWKFGFPETILYMYTPLVDPNSTTVGNISDILNSTGTVAHHGAASFLICMLVTGVVFPDQHVISPILILLMQHWFVLTRYVNSTLYIVSELILEALFEWIVLSNFQYLVANHWTASLAAGVMLVAHWEYLAAAGFSMLKSDGVRSSAIALSTDRIANRLSMVNLADEEAIPFRTDFRYSTIGGTTTTVVNQEYEGKPTNLEEEVSGSEEEQQVAQKSM